MIESSYDLDYYTIIKQAIEYNIGDLEKVEDMIDLYTYDKFLFQFPPKNKNSLTIYLYDNRYDLFSNFNNATLKVYEQGKWLIYGQWVDVLNDYIMSLYEQIQESLEDLEKEKRERELEEERKRDELIVRFAELFGIDFVDGFNALQFINLNKLIDNEELITEDIEAIKFVSELYGLDIIQVPNLTKRSEVDKS